MSTASSYAAEMAAKYGPITTWAALMRAARAEGWPMPLADLRLRAYQAASPARGSDGEAARRAAATGARCAAEAAGLVAIIAIDAETKAAADWASIEYICGVLDGAGRAAGSP